MATRIYEFGEGGHIDAISLTGDDLVRRNDPFAVASLREPGVLQRFSQLVFHYPIVAREVRLQERADQIAETSRRRRPTRSRRECRRSADDLPPVFWTALSWKFQLCRMGRRRRVL